MLVPLVVEGAHHGSGNGGKGECRLSAIVSRCVGGTLACRFTDCRRVAEVASTFALRACRRDLRQELDTILSLAPKACRGLFLPGFVGGDVLCVRRSQGP